MSMLVAIIMCSQEGQVEGLLLGLAYVDFGCHYHGYPRASLCETHPLALHKGYETLVFLTPSP